MPPRPTPLDELDAIFGLAVVLEKRGEPDAAAWYQKYLQTAPEGQYAGIAQRHLARLQTRAPAP